MNAPDPTAQGEQLDPDFFVCANTYLDIANQQARGQGLRRVSAAILYAAARYNVHAFLGFETDVRGNREEFIAYMQGLYRRMLEEHLETIAAERGIDLSGTGTAAPSAGTSGDADTAQAG